MKYHITDYDNYNSFINLILNNSSHFSLCYSKKDTESVSKFRKETEPYSVSEFAYNKFITPGYNRGQKFVIYKITEQTKKIILQTKSFKDWDLINLPEDICFYYHKKAWVNYVSHEDFLFIDFPNDEIKNSLKILV